MSIQNDSTTKVESNGIDWLTALTVIVSMIGVVTLISVPFITRGGRDIPIPRSQDPRYSIVKVTSNDYPGATQNDGATVTNVVKFCDGGNLVYKINNTGISVINYAYECYK